MKPDLDPDLTLDDERANVENQEETRRERLSSLIIASFDQATRIRNETAMPNIEVVRPAGGQRLHGAPLTSSNLIVENLTMKRNMKSAVEGRRMVG